MAENLEDVKSRLAEYVLGQERSHQLGLRTTNLRFPD